MGVATVIRVYLTLINYAAIYPKTRAEATHSDNPRYFTGRPCLRGHIVPRFASSGACTECHREDATEAYWKSLGFPTGDTNLHVKINGFNRNLQALVTTLQAKAIL